MAGRGMEGMRKELFLTVSQSGYKRGKEKSKLCFTLLITYPPVSLAITTCIPA
jgi:hypothetical protein